jgi:uncharacterized low-complexity protein
MNTSNKTLGLALAATLGAAGVAGAADSPFAMQTMDKGYQLAQADKTTSGKCGAAKCGANMKAKSTAGTCGAGKCSVDMMDANKDGKADKAEFLKHHEAMFEKMDTNKDGMIDSAELAKGREGMCGAKAKAGACGAKAKEAKCGAKPAAKPAEGKCGQGKCGGMK